MDRRTLLQSIALLPLLLASARGGAQDAAARWRRVEAVARGQSVYFNAWGGDSAINRYIAWAAGELDRRHGVRLVHVKVTDIAEAVTRLLAERAAGRAAGGSIDLLWLNGENFASLKEAGLLWGPWVQALPHAPLIDSSNPTTSIDMTLPTAGYEMPWGGARFTLLYDSARVALPPRTPAELRAWIEAHPGRFTYPQPPAFIGTSFLKQLLLLLVDDAAPFAAPPTPVAATQTGPLWAWLDATRPSLWRGGRAFPASGPAQRRLLADGEVDFALAFNPAEASRAIAAGELPATVRGLHFSGGALANSHFLAIPANARAKEGALVVADFLLSPGAQARKADERHWGDPTVLDVARLPPAEAAYFADLATGPATPSPPARLLPEPHPAWVGWLEAAWSRRYLGA
ncbi:MAG: ABC transporter substrate-binding protein [Chromatiales bacterium]|nr:ABC transporter substrate-binding protein [Chromatiales bacterium]